jgi:hypothetical protein
MISFLRRNDIYWLGDLASNRQMTSRSISSINQEEWVWLEWMTPNIGMNSIIMGDFSGWSSENHAQLCKDFNKDWEHEQLILSPEKGGKRARLSGYPLNQSDVVLSPPYELKYKNMLDAMPSGLNHSYWINLQNNIHTWLFQHPYNQNNTPVQGWLWGKWGKKKRHNTTILTALQKYSIVAVSNKSSQGYALALALGWDKDQIICWDKRILKNHHLPICLAPANEEDLDYLEKYIQKQWRFRLSRQFTVRIELDT